MVATRALKDAPNVFTAQHLTWQCQLLQLATSNNDRDSLIVRGSNNLRSSFAADFANCA